MMAIKTGIVLTVILALAGCTTGGSVDGAYDTVISGGTVYDGGDAPGRVADVAIRGNRVVAVGDLGTAIAPRVIDASGLVVLPGFIDPHTHAIKDLLAEDRKANLNYLLQGVTTVVVGNDGDGMPERQARFAHIRQGGIGPHLAFFAGHGQIRRAVMGRDNRAPTADELRHMQYLLDADMQAGALGLSSGLFYVPGVYADSEEVVELARVAARYGGIYDTHIRSEGSYSIGLLAAIDEALDVGRRANIPVHLSHIKALGRDVWGQSADVIARIERAREEGIEVSANQYPWRASGTRFSNALVPRRLMADSKAAMQERLRDPAVRARIEPELRANLARRGGADAMLVTAADNSYRGRTLADIAAGLGVEPIWAALDLVLAGDPSIASFVMDEDDILAFAAEPWVVTGSDGSRGHPRKFATYPKAYRDFVVEKKIMSMERFVRRGTGQVADIMQLCDRGYLRPGYRADIAVIDPLRYRPAASYEAPTELTPGTAYVLIDGVFAVDRGEWTGALPGTIVHRQQLECPNDG